MLLFYELNELLQQEVSRSSYGAHNVVGITELYKDESFIDVPPSLLPVELTDLRTKAGPHSPKERRGAEVREVGFVATVAEGRARMHRAAHLLWRLLVGAVVPARRSRPTARGARLCGGERVRRFGSLAGRTAVACHHKNFAAVAQSVAA